MHAAAIMAPEGGEVHDAMALLEKWYASRCDGEWEHSYGVEIETIDNPGWVVKIDLRRTPKEKAALDPVKLDRSDTDWIRYWTEKGQFHIACGAQNLSESIHIFLKWFESQ
jgi:hypothetical protein